MVLKTGQFQFKALLMSVISAYTLPQYAMAENRAEALETDVIEVVGTTPLGGLGVPIDQVPSNVQTAKGKEMQHQQSLNLPDFINQNLTGVNVNETQNNPYQPNVNFRGFTASPLLGTPQGLSVYQDGVRINEPFGDTVNWDLIPQNAIANIVLMPGSNPLFGLNTLGGALSVQTKSGEHFPGGGIQVLGGSWGRWAVEGEYGGKLDNGVGYFFAGNQFKEQGWRDSSPSDVLQGFGKIGWNNEKTDIDISFSGADTNLVGNGYTPQSLLRQFGYEAINTKPDRTENKLGFINGKLNHWFTDELLLTTNAYYRHNLTKTLNGDINDMYEGLLDACDGLGLGAACEALYAQGVNNRSKTTNKSYGGSLQLTWATERNQLIGGASVDLGRTRFTQTEQEAAAFNAQRGFDASVLDSSIETVNDLTGRSKTWSLFATDIFNLTPKLAVTVSGRFNHTRINLTDNLAGHKEGVCLDVAGGVVASDDPACVALVQGSADDAGGKHTYKRFNPALGLTYSLKPELNMYAGYNEGNRAPSPIETGCADPNFPCLLPNAMAGDPPLKQVVAKTFEGGFRGKLGNNIRWSAGAYRTTNYNDLQFIASGTTGAGYFDNVGKTRRQGLDFGINGATGDFNWSAGYSYVNATYQDGFDLASEANSSRFVDSNGNKVIHVSSGDKLAGIPEHQLKLRGEWRAMPNWTIGATTVAFSDQYARGNENNKHKAVDAANSFDGNDYAGSGKVRGYAVLNLDTRYKFTNTGWQIFAKVNNVLDHEYYTSGLLGENAFTAAGGTFATDANSKKELFLAPGAPRAGWIGLRYDFGGGKATTSVD